MNGWIGWSLVALGFASVAIGTIGILRVRDGSLRIKALSMINGPGAVCLHTGLAFLHPHGFQSRALLAAIFFLITGPAVVSVLQEARQRRSRREPAGSGGGAGPPETGGR